jgi:hypothetical protein
MEVQEVLEKAREKVTRDGTPEPKGEAPVRRVAVRAALSVLALVGFAALLRPRRPAPPPRPRFRLRRP